MKRGSVNVAKWTAAALGGLVITCGAATASAQTMENVMFAGPNNAGLLARVYKPSNQTSGRPGAVMLHGCTGMWSNNTPPTYGTTTPGSSVTQDRVAQSHIEKWGRKLASMGYWAIAVDSYTTRGGTQNQCGGSGSVDPYTQRVDDFYAAKDHLLSTFDAAPNGVGVIGWSQGAETTLVVSAETPKDTDTTYCSMGVSQCADRMADRPAAAVAFYPGCGPSLEFGFVIGNGTQANPQDPGFFRPDIPLRWNHGEADTTTPIGPCRARMNEALTYPTSDIEVDTYASVTHSFDQNTGTTNAERWAFPTSKCTAAEAAIASNAELCARRDADIDSLAFFVENVVEE